MATDNPPKRGCIALPLNRRKLLKAGIPGAIAAVAGCFSDIDTMGSIDDDKADKDDRFLSVSDGAVIFADDFNTALSVRDDAASDVSVAWTMLGNVYTWGRGVIDLPDITVKVGGTSYDDAVSMVDTYPTIVITENGNQYVFYQ